MLNSSAEHDRIEGEISNLQKSSDPFVSAVRATRMPMIITDPNLPDNPIVFVNNAFTKLTGYPRQDIIGRNCRFLQGERTDADGIAKIRDAIKNLEPVELDLYNRKKDGSYFWNRLLISPVFDEVGKLSYFFAPQFDVTIERERLADLERARDVLEKEIKARTVELSDSEDRLRFILKAGRFGAWTFDMADETLVVSDVFKENFGCDPSEPFEYKDVLEAILPEDRERMRLAVKQSIEDGTDYDIEYRIRTPKGEVRWILIRGQTSYGPDGAPIARAGVSLDITDRKRGDEHRMVLADELKHRVKNTIATVQVIAKQTLRNATSLEEAEPSLDNRLQSHAVAHDVLTREDWAGASLPDVVEQALRPFREAGKFELSGPLVRLEAKPALSIMMALHELATNAVKYGALSGPSGRVVVKWGIVANGGQPRELRLRWEEQGGPPVTPPTRTGFGSRLIGRVLASELSGTAEIDYLPGGVVFQLEAPLPV